MLAAWVVATSFTLNFYPSEMLAAGIINGIAGVLAIVPMLLVVGKGTLFIARTALLATTLRMILVLIGLVLAYGPGWHLQHTPIIAWAGLFYAVMLISEGIAVSWVMRR